jgi:hypothetical protein
MPLVLVSFDLKDANSEDYKKGYDLLNDLGLFQFSANKQLQLPDSTVLGQVNLPGKAADIRDSIAKKLSNACGKEVKRIAVAVVKDWAVQGEES